MVTSLNVRAFLAIAVVAACGPRPGDAGWRRPAIADPSSSFADLGSTRIAAAAMRYPAPRVSGEPKPPVSISE
jgi:hypothetical protein